MGEVRETITLVNIADTARAGDGLIPESQVRQIAVDAVVDTGAMSLVIGEGTCRRLGLAVERESGVLLVGGVKQACKVAGPVGIRWKDRSTIIHAVVLPGEDDVLMGCLPLEDIDLMVNPVERCLTGAHGDEWVRWVR